MHDQDATSRAALEGRLEELERQLSSMRRRGRGLGLVAFAGAGMALALGAHKPPEVFQAQRIEVIDAEGNVRAAMYATGNESGFMLRDDKGRQRGFLSVEGGLASLALLDGKGNKRADLSVRNEADSSTVSDAAAFAFYDEEQNQRVSITQNDQKGPSMDFHARGGGRVATLGVEQKGPQLSFFNSDGSTRVSLSAVAASSGLNLHDWNGRPKASLGVSLNGNPALMFSDDQMHRRGEFGLAESGPEILLFDSNGQVSFEAP